MISERRTKTKKQHKREYTLQNNNKRMVKASTCTHNTTPAGNLVYEEQWHQVGRGTKMTDSLLIVMSTCLFLRRLFIFTCPHTYCY